MLLTGYSITPKRNLRGLYGKRKLTSAIINNLFARANEQDTVGESSNKFIFVFRERDECHDVLLARADGVLNDNEDVKDCYNGTKDTTDN